MKELATQRLNDMKAAVQERMLDDPSRPLRYPDDGPMQYLVDRCYTERRKLLVCGIETGRDSVLHIQPSIGHLAAHMLNENGAVDLARFREVMTAAGDGYTIE